MATIKKQHSFVVDKKNSNKFNQRARPIQREREGGGEEKI